LQDEDLVAQGEDLGVSLVAGSNQPAQAGHDQPGQRRHDMVPALLRSEIGVARDDLGDGPVVIAAGAPLSERRAGFR